ncbi:MAG: hypothetical protein JO211_02850 [Acidobacteriaceae bacterium]|nr:hypothetical protein [Acidobacteriaceae bacterium]
MEQASLVKVVAAFVAGVVVALGSALIYVRASDIAQSAPAVDATVAPPRSAPPQLPDTTQDVTDPPSPAAVDDTTAPSESEPARAPKPHHVAPVFRDTVITPHRSPAPSRPPLELARNTTPAEQPPAPVSDPPPVSTDAPPDSGQLQQQTTSAPEAPIAPPPVPAPQPHVVTLDSGTPVAIRLAETLSTDHNYTGDTFRATLESPIIRDGFIIADKGSKVLGRIVNAERAGRVEGLANMTLAVTEINTTDGQRIHIESTTYAKKGPASTGEDAAKIAGGAALGAIIGAVAGGGKGAAIGAGVGGAAGTGAVMVTRGKPAVFPVETRLTFRLAVPVTITEKLNR